MSGFLWLVGALVAIGVLLSTPPVPVQFLCLFVVLMTPAKIMASIRGVR